VSSFQPLFEAVNGAIICETSFCGSHWNDPEKRRTQKIINKVKDGARRGRPQLKSRAMSACISASVRIRNELLKVLYGYGGLA
jgi:hypothetical protein